MYTSIYTCIYRPFEAISNWDVLPYMGVGDELSKIVSSFEFKLVLHPLYGVPHMT